MASELQSVVPIRRRYRATDTGNRTTMNVLFVSETRFTHTPYRDSSTRYRCYHMAEALQAAGYLADVCALSNVDLVNLSRYDIVSVQQPSASRKLLGILERCDKLGIKTVADIDTLEFDPALVHESPKCQLKNSSESSVRAAFMRQRLALQHFDEVCAATEELARARRVQAPSQPVYVAANGLSNFWLSCNDQLIPKEQPSRRISYFSGSRSLDADFANAAQAISEHLQQNSEHEFNVIGPLDVNSLEIESAQLVRGAWTDFMNVPRELARTWISIAPLNNTRINYAKPHTKFIESAAFGVPIVCAPTEDLKRHDVDGLHLVENTGEWLQAFEALSDKEYYQACQKSLYEYARDCCQANHSVVELIKQWSATNEPSENETLTTLSAAS